MYVPMNYANMTPWTFKGAGSLIIYRLPVFAVLLSGVGVGQTETQGISSFDGRPFFKRASPF